jgi:Peptidase family S49
VVKLARLTQPRAAEFAFANTLASIPELAEAVRAVSRQKPTVALIDPLCASPALWAISGARSIIATPSSEVGSIGVLTTRVSIDEHLKQQGIAVTVVSAGKFKSEGHEVLPITPAEQAELQRRVDAKAVGLIDRVARRDVAAARSVARRRASHRLTFSTWRRDGRRTRPEAMSDGSVRRSDGDRLRP